MSSHFAKPENALRKARDLVRVQKESSALKTLHNILISKRFRLWQPTHEQIMVSTTQHPITQHCTSVHSIQRTSSHARPLSWLLCVLVCSTFIWSWPFSCVAM